MEAPWPKSAAQANRPHIGSSGWRAAAPAVTLRAARIAAVEDVYGGMIVAPIPDSGTSTGERGDRPGSGRANPR
jgi:hypothetical protein